MQAQQKFVLQNCIYPKLKVPQFAIFNAIITDRTSLLPCLSFVFLCSVFKVQLLPEGQMVENNGIEPSTS